MEQERFFTGFPGWCLTCSRRGAIFQALRVTNAAAAGLRAGVVPGSGVKSKHVLCLEVLGVSVKHRPNYPVQGVVTTDRKRPFSFKAGRISHE